MGPQLFINLNNSAIPPLLRFSKNLIVILDLLLFVSEKKERILQVLEKLEKLRKMGLIDDEYYQEKRNILLSNYLELEDEITHVVKEEPQLQYSDRSRKIYKALLISLLLIGILLLGVVIGNEIYPFTKVSTYTTSLFIEKPTTITKEYVYTVTKTVTAPFIPYDQANVYEGTPKLQEEKIIYSGSLDLEKSCQVKVFSINAEKGDRIKVYWEANDDEAYVAIGTPAHYAENVKTSYCETTIIFWRYSWPAADYGYSGSLQFTVPSSGTWYVVIANGNYHCIFSECPITFTRLEIKHIRS
ncbi:MAG: hypothetical protein QXL22_05705 [Candidatus Nezhaarchaeales archaeon]